MGVRSAVNSTTSCICFSIEQCVISQKSERSLPGVVRLLLDKFVAEGVKGAARNWLARFLYKKANRKRV